MNHFKPYIVGISGYLGSGKTTVLRFFEQNGFFCIDADAVVHELYKPGNDGWKKIRDFFGEDYLIEGKGSVDRDTLRRVVFNNTHKLRILEKLIHPLVFNEMNKQIHATQHPNIAIEAIRFDDKRLGFSPDTIVWVDAPHETALQRTRDARNITRQEYESIVAMQQKPEHIDHVIRNDSTLEVLEERINALIKRLVSKSV